MRAVDLFAGAGGWTTGATQAGARVLAAVNHWPRAVETHAANHPETLHRCQDIALMDPRELPAHDLLLASPACQGHTPARGKERPHHDASRATAWCVVDVVEVTRPELLVVENVPAFRSWTLYGLWTQALGKLGYQLEEHVLDAAHFGTPQERRRLIITGRLGAAAPRITPPMLPAKTARQLVRWEEGMWKPIQGLADATMRRLKAGRAAFGDRLLVPYFSANRTGRSVDRPIGTLTTKDRYLVVDGDRCRMLSLDEAREAMGFPESYRLLGSKTEQLKQLGNAVPPPLARGVVQQILRAA